MSSKEDGCASQWGEIHLTTVVSDLLDYCGVGHRWQLLDMGDIFTNMNHFEVNFDMHIPGYM